MRNRSDSGAGVSLADVARRAGVSKATASKALNGRPGVSAESRGKVRSAVRELGYEPPAVRAVGLRQVAFVADNMTTTYTLEVMGGSMRAAMHAGVALTAQFTPGDGDYAGPVPLEPEWFDLVHGAGFLGVLAVTSRLDAAELAKIDELGLPIVVVDPVDQLPATMVSISATNWNGGVEATKHLVDLGHRRIAFVRGPHASMPSEERFQGYLSALQMSGIDPDPRLVAGDDFTHAAGFAVGTELLQLPANRRPTAFFAATDVSALGVHEAARQLGLRVPDDVSVVGFDDTFLAELSTPQLTTVRQPLEDMGSAALRMVLALASGQPTTPGTIRLATELVVRGSTQPPG
ncbi:MAG: LacI family transcriptional regulator [Propionibacterium sp.]|nr:LacI family transcriptional regulator [Propionibacterium sp.]